jgi:iron-sulfur cluster assembly accessory protein
MTISDKAAEKAKALLVDEGKAEWGIRVYIAGESCCGPSYGLNLQEGQMPNDEVIEKNGLRVFVDRHILESLTGMELDYYTDEEREGFILTGGISSCGSCSSGGDSCG